MTKIIKAEYNNATLEKLYNKYLNNGALDSALNILDKVYDLNGESTEIYSSYANIYYKMGLYERAINYWYKYLSVAEDKELAKGYNGLGACHYKIDNKQLAGYYFNEQINTKDKSIYEYNDVGADFFDELYDDKNNYYLAYPFDKADFTKTVNRSSELIKIGEYDKALDVLSIIPKESRFYSDALIQSALCYYFNDDKEKSLLCINEALKNNPTDLIALCNAISLYSDAGDKKSVKKLVEKLTKLPEGKDFDNLYKIFMVYCEVGEYLLAESVAKQILKKEPFNLNVLFLYGITEYNLGKYDVAESVFLRCYLIVKSYVFKHYYKLSSKAKISKSKTRKKLVYTFDLTANDKKEILTKLGQAILDDGASSVSKQTIDDFVSYSYEIHNYNVQSSVVSLLFKLNTEYCHKKLKEVLLNSNYFDRIKVGIIGYLVNCGFNGNLSVVYGNVFKKITLYKASFGEDGIGCFNDAYSLLCAKISCLENDLYTVKITAEKMYNIAKENGFLNDILDVKALSATIYEFANIKPIISRRAYAKFFDANLKSIKKIKDLYLNLGVKIGEFKV